MQAEWLTVLTGSIQQLWGGILHLAAIGLGAAIAFGLGGRDAAAEMIRDFLRSSDRAGTPSK